MYTHITSHGESLGLWQKRRLASTGPTQAAGCAPGQVLGIAKAFLVGQGRGATPNLAGMARCGSGHRAMLVYAAPYDAAPSCVAGRGMPHGEGPALVCNNLPVNPPLAFDPQRVPRAGGLIVITVRFLAVAGCKRGWGAAMKIVWRGPDVRFGRELGDLILVGISSKAIHKPPFDG